MVDEATDVSNVEQASICVRCIRIKNEKEVCEEFLGFCSLPSTNAATITSKINEFMVTCTLNMTNLVGKGFNIQLL